MSQFQERYRPAPIAADGTLTLPATCNIGGFLCKTAGAITVIDSKGVTVVNAVAVAAGTWLPIPFLLAGGGTPVVITLSGGAVGTVGVY